MQGINTDFTGRTLGPYQLLQRIGRGGMSVVYLAEQTDLQRRVAIKILFPGVPPGSAMYLEFLERFRREARLIASLEHPGIVTIHDYKEQADTAYIVMPYFPRKSLADLLIQRGSLSLQETLEYMEQATHALGYAHKQGVIHRDLKPSNFLLHEDGHLVLTDFGIAYMMRSTTTGLLTSTNVVLGTPEYIAPEMILKQPLDHRADIYELGIVLFQMLTGRLPFLGRNPIELQMKHLSDPPPFLYHIDPSIPVSVDAVMRTATAKEAEKRYRSVEEMASALRSAIKTSSPEQFGPFSPTVASLPQNYASPTWKQTVPIDQSGLVGSMPSSSLPARPRTKKSTWISILAVLAVCFISTTALLPMIIPPHPPTTRGKPSPTPVLQPSQEAKNSVTRYYASLNKRDYQDAYQSSVSTPDNTLCDFVNGFASTELDRVQFLGEPEARNSTTFDVPIILYATEQMPEGNRESSYQGFQRVTLKNGTWKIDGGSLPTMQLGSPTPLIPDGSTASDKAIALLQKFYTYIDKHDYPAAYNLWGGAFRSQNSYCDFIKGYADTLQNTLTCSTPSLQADGSLAVPVVIKAKEKRNSNMIISTYEGGYIVGAEKAPWQILQGTLKNTSSA